MLASTLSRPPQRAQRSMSMANTRLGRAAQVMATCRGVEFSAVPARRCAPGLRPASVTAACSAASRAMKSKGSSTMCVVPSRYGVWPVCS